MWERKAKAAPEEEPWEPEPEEREENLPTWADGSSGPQNTVSRIFGRQRGEEAHEARLATAE